MTINPDAPTLFDLDGGELIEVEIDTEYQWQPKDPANPISGLSLESGGTCFFYQFEHGAWFRSEYHGDSNRVPQLRKKIPASEAGVRERERAREEWERTQGRMPVTGVSRFPIVLRDEGIASQSMDMPQPGTTTSAPSASASTGYGPAFPQAATQLPRSRTADRRTNATRPEVPGHSKHRRRINDPSFPFGPAGSPQGPTFPPGFPFMHNAPRPHFPNIPPGPLPNMNQPSMPTGPSPPMPTAHGSNRGTIIDGNYLSVRGKITNMNSNESIDISGHGKTVNWSPDYHSELRGTYDMN